MFSLAGEEELILLADTRNQGCVLADGSRPHENEHFCQDSRPISVEQYDIPAATAEFSVDLTGNYMIAATGEREGSQPYLAIILAEDPTGARRWLTARILRVLKSSRPR